MSLKDDYFIPLTTYEKILGLYRLFTAVLHRDRYNPCMVTAAHRRLIRSRTDEVAMPRRNLE